MRSIRVGHVNDHGDRLPVREATFPNCLRALRELLATMYELQNMPRAKLQQSLDALLHLLNGVAHRYLTWE